MDRKNDHTDSRSKTPDDPGDALLQLLRLVARRVAGELRRKETGEPSDNPKETH